MSFTGDFEKTETYPHENTPEEKESIINYTPYSMVTEKLPEECSRDELKRYLEGKQFKIHPNAPYAELLNQAKLFLLSQGKSRICCPENSIFGVIRHYGRKTLDLVSTKSEPPVHFSTPNFETSRYYVPPIPNYQRSEFSDEHIYDEPSIPEVQEISNRLQNVIVEPPRPRESEQTQIIETRRGHDQTQMIAPSVSVAERSRAPIRKRTRIDPEISHIQPPQNVSLPTPHFNNQHMESSPYHRPVIMQPQNRVALANESFSYSRPSKFTQKFDATKVSIEDYLQSISRWKRSNNVNDILAISTCLENFSDIGLANTIDGNLTEFEKHDFEAFTSSLIEKLGRPGESWMDEFETMKRANKEAPFTFLSRLSAALKKGHNINVLTSEHKRLVLRRFVNGSHQKVREQLKLRNDLTFDNCAEMSRRIEEAFEINGGATVTINHIEKSQNSEKTSNRPNVTRFNSPPPRREPCHICHQSNHLTKHCFGNLASPFFSKEKFERFNQPKN